ncbi:MAG TPA: sugar phosphorylase, partial [Anaerolineae bacterium]|nr:sugar phosphorylase [Anaerolineae bacterium]
MMQFSLANIVEHLTFLYGPMVGRTVSDRISKLIDHYRSLGLRSHIHRRLSSQDAILITYGDQVRASNEAPLHTLADFCQQHLLGLLNTIHLLPFYPYSSDDGFSVIDYRQVDPALGTWPDIDRIGLHFHLMFDAVINHISAESDWFKQFLQDDPRYRDYFIVIEDDPDLSQVVRPRTLPLLTEVSTPLGERKVWTTFSADQIDLNYRNPDVLLEIIDTLLFYVAHGAEFLRLDAIAYLWKEIGTACIHLPQTHRIIQLLRSILDAVAPNVMLITETNVPHQDNISYFGDGTHEAQLVYNFALPPLVLHTFLSGDAQALSHWAAGLVLPSGQTAFFNFLASHDGIGLNPVRGILKDVEIDRLVDHTLRHGGLVSYKHNADDTASPYELNINYFDALSDPEGPEPIETQIDRFMAAQAIMLALIGVPGIYFHSLFGSRGWPEGTRLTHQNRTINRQKIERDQIERELADPTSLRHIIFNRYAQLLRARSSTACFDPHGSQRVIECGQAIFALERRPPDMDRRVVCLINVSAQPRIARIDLSGVFNAKSSFMIDLIDNKKFDVVDPQVHLQPYEVLWLTTE